MKVSSSLKQLIFVSTQTHTHKRAENAQINTIYAAA